MSRKMFYSWCYSVSHNQRLFLILPWFPLRLMRTLHLLSSPGYSMWVTIHSIISFQITIRIPPSFVHPTIFNFHGHNFIGNNISNRIYGWSDNLSFHIPHISPQMLFQCDYLKPKTVSLPGITFDEFIFVKTSWIIFLSSFVQNLQKFDNYWHPSNFIALVNTMLKCTNFQFHFEYEMCN